jgi:hypothetical protein
MSRKAQPPERMPLETFLARLDSEDADAAREAAKRMRLNEQTASRLRGIERELMPFFIAAIVSFLFALTAILFFAEPGGLVDRIDGAWPVLIACLAFFPVMLVVYAIRIRKRSAADMDNIRLNQAHFLPHAAIYFPSDAPVSEQVVTLVGKAGRSGGWRSKFETARPGAIW